MEARPSEKPFRRVPERLTRAMAVVAMTVFSGGGRAPAAAGRTSRKGVSGGRRWRANLRGNFKFEGSRRRRRSDKKLDEAPDTSFWRSDCGHFRSAPRMESHDPVGAGPAAWPSLEKYLSAADAQLLRDWQRRQDLATTQQKQQQIALSEAHEERMRFLSPVKDAQTPAGLSTSGMADTDSQTPPRHSQSSSDEHHRSAAAGDGLIGQGGQGQHSPVKSDGVANHVAVSSSQRDCFGEDDEDESLCEHSPQSNLEEDRSEEADLPPMLMKQAPSQVHSSTYLCNVAPMILVLPV